MDVENIVIIGSGPAGYTAAIYTARANLKPLLFEGQRLGGQPGGQLMLTTEVENFPGFPEGLMGPEMMEKFKKQAQRFETRIVSEDITSVDFSARPFKLTTGEKQILAQTVIICTGAQAMWMGIPGEQRYQGHGVSACATCDGFFFRDKEILVVGGGDSALEEALFLTRFASKVSIVHRRDQLRASKIMQERAMKNSKIVFIWNTQVQEVLGYETKMTGVRVLNNQTNEVSELKADGLFVAIGHKPNTQIFEGQIELDQKGYIVTRSGSTVTSVEGVFAGGDVADHKYRQAVTAAGTGCMAALDAERWLADQE
ncbi:MAG: Thioredoxin reductase [Candidatus Uhrbacteria bacterium GW2011_GWF2_39_13]|uniref:Thioredoxin reductase n=1 Tax=Candidatus Uhrbacteria bacterium GW2011_GWF2_39_13 TaxID=1618995 RepID=A0A0G0MM28_9BACT|nr:MAG: Thioredoxin reductase [Candidatus Uhrbacteria bacterium GW2011_GWF2_39_13]HAU66660.1 thioredoxin-disulfide reductase [Candidatus Uhrbacteria bacterium]